MEQARKHNKVSMEGKKKTRKVKGSKKPGKDEIYKSLKNKISISREEFDQCHKGREFQDLCPNGEMTKDQFLEKSKDRIGAGGFSESLFRVFDEDGSGFMDFGEYIMAVNCTNFTEPEAKLTWIFNVFDQDGGGSIDIDEVINLVIGLFTMGGIEAEKEVLLSCVQEILEAIDENNDGEITRDEFVENARKSAFIKDLIGED